MEIHETLPLTIKCLPNGLVCVIVKSETLFLWSF
uniref:Uncharacterized protein n=1 Tax=Rhizophora mucronata TaxID=61149 RepID=A0A2P2M7T7_RHIMU